MSFRFLQTTKTTTYCMSRLEDNLLYESSRIDMYM
jgi:hypothetical protein